jgi:hypothetical protein
MDNRAGADADTRADPDVGVDHGAVADVRVRGDRG